jgi:hypothetical protein
MVVYFLNHLIHFVKRLATQCLRICSATLDRASRFQKTFVLWGQCMRDARDKRRMPCLSKPVYASCLLLSSAHSP